MPKKPPKLKTKTKTKTIKELYYICECGEEIKEDEVNIKISALLVPRTTISWDCPKCNKTKTYRENDEGVMELLISVPCKCAACGAESKHWKLEDVE